MKVNTNAIGTIIRQWWTEEFQEHDNWKLVELVDNVIPVEVKDSTDNIIGHKRTLNMTDKLNHRLHIKTHLHRTDFSGGDGGHVLFPFASTTIVVNGKIITDDSNEAKFIPDTSKWSSYYIRIEDTSEGEREEEKKKNVDILKLGNPSVRTVGTPLFLEFENNRHGHDVVIKFEPEYDAGKGIILPPKEVVSGILLFDERGYWKLYTPWTYRDISLSNRGRAQIILDKPGSRTLTGSEYLRRIIDVSGTISSPRDLIFPLDDGSDWLVRNKTGQNIIVRGSKGSSVTIPPSFIKAVFTDGSGFYGSS